MKFPHNCSEAEPESFPIVAVTGTMPLGGSSTFLINLAIGMRSHGRKLVLIVMGKNNPYREEFLAAGGILHEISREDSIYEDRLNLVYRLTAGYRPAMVLSCLSAETFEVLRYVPQGVLRVGMVQADDPGVYRMVAHFTRWLDRMVGVSQSIQQRLSEMPGIGSEKSTYIPYGIAFPSLPERPSPAPSAPLRVVYAGRLLEEQKRISRIIQVVTTLADGSGKFEFTIAGSGPADALVRDKLAPLPGVHFAGELGNSAVIELFASHDVYLLLSDYEGLPLSLLEAMGMGCVPVVSDLESGIRQVVTIDCGIRVPVGDIPFAVSALRSLASDRNLCSTMRTASIKTSRSDYSALRMASRYLALAELKIRDSDRIPWKRKLRWILTPMAIEPRWHYRQPIRTFRRIRKWLMRFRLGVSDKPRKG